MLSSQLKFKNLYVKPIVKLYKKFVLSPCVKKVFQGKALPHSAHYLPHYYESATKNETFVVTFTNKLLDSRSQDFILDLIYEALKINKTFYFESDVYQISDAASFISKCLKEYTNESKVKNSIYNIEHLMAYINKQVELKDASNTKYTDCLISINEELTLGLIGFVSIEFGKWSASGGLGVMINDLSNTLSITFKQSVCVVTPLYDTMNTEEFLKQFIIKSKHVVSINICGFTHYFNVIECTKNEVEVLFLQNNYWFPCPYPRWSNIDSLLSLSLIGKASLEAFLVKNKIPDLIVTNDWPTGLIASYAKQDKKYYNSFKKTKFFHLIHNLDLHYQGLIYDNNLSHAFDITQLQKHLLVDVSWRDTVYNPSRCALLASDGWGTVSPAYCAELKKTNELSTILNRYPNPFAFPNGVFNIGKNVESGLEAHLQAKQIIQQKYFGFKKLDKDVSLFAFVGRITEQKGVHLIVDAAEQLILTYNYKIQILVGGKVVWHDPYSCYCGLKMIGLHNKYPHCFWADTEKFFSDGELINLGVDMGLMPSKFEPGGIVQHEFFNSETPVLAYKTGGLKDTVINFDKLSLIGNGVMFENYNLPCFIEAIDRAIDLIQCRKIYKRLRENAKRSVISCEKVSEAWLNEFRRITNKFVIDTRLYNIYRMFINKNLSDSNNDIYKLKNRKMSSSTLSQRYVFETYLKTEFYDEPRLFYTLLGLSISNTKKAPKKYQILSFTYKPQIAFRNFEVSLSGSYNMWQTCHQLVWNSKSDAYVVKLMIKPGDYWYRIAVGNSYTIKFNQKHSSKYGVSIVPITI